MRKADAIKLAAGDVLVFRGEEESLKGLLFVSELDPTCLHVTNEKGHSTRLPYNSPFTLKLLRNMQRRPKD